MHKELCNGFGLFEMTANKNCQVLFTVAKLKTKVEREKVEMDDEVYSSCLTIQDASVQFPLRRPVNECELLKKVGLVQRTETYQSKL